MKTITMNVIRVRMCLVLAVLIEGSANPIKLRTVDLYGGRNTGETRGKPSEQEDRESRDPTRVRGQSPSMRSPY